MSEIESSEGYWKITLKKSLLGCFWKRFHGICTSHPSPHVVSKILNPTVPVGMRVHIKIRIHKSSVCLYILLGSLKNQWSAFYVTKCRNTWLPHCFPGLGLALCCGQVAAFLHFDGPSLRQRNHRNLSESSWRPRCQRDEGKTKSRHAHPPLGASRISITTDCSDRWRFVLLQVWLD